MHVLMEDLADPYEIMAVYFQFDQAFGLRVVHLLHIVDLAFEARNELCCDSLVDHLLEEVADHVESVEADFRVFRGGLDGRNERCVVVLVVFVGE